MESAPTCYLHPQEMTRIVCQRCDRPICPDCMRPSAVGFQCPQCVQEGVRATRQIQLPYGGMRSRDPRITTIVLIATNIAIWLAVVATGGTASRILDTLAMMPYGRCEVDSNGYFFAAYQDCIDAGMQWLPGVATGAPWQVLTSGFTHESLMHIGFNMLVLWMLGPQLEAILGRVRFLAVYFAAILGGAAMVMFGETYTQTLGASGAIYGLLGALLLLAIKHRGDVQQILIWLVLNIAISFTFPGISWQGHIGGLVAGFAAAAAIILIPKQLRARWQWPAVAAVVVIMVAAILVGCTVSARVVG